MYKRPEFLEWTRFSAKLKIMHHYLGTIVVHPLSTCDCLSYRIPSRMPVYLFHVSNCFQLQCTSECSGGNRTRSVTCEAEGTPVDESMCTEEKPAETEPCNLDPCGELTIGNWTEV